MVALHAMNVKRNGALLSATKIRFPAFAEMLSHLLASKIIMPAIWPTFCMLLLPTG